MKVLVAVALCGLAAVVYAFPQVEPEVQPEVPVDLAFTPECPNYIPEYVVLIGNPDNCTTYYSCNGNVPVLMPCPPGLHFNDKAKVCDYPYLACCDPAFDPEKKCKKSA